MSSDDFGSPPEQEPESDEAKPGKSLFPEGLRKVLATGANHLFSSEEGGKKPLGELRLPKEAVQFLMAQADRGRKDLFRAARHEMRRVLSSVDMRGELRRALLGLKVQVKAEITFTEEGAKIAVTHHDVAGTGKKKPRPKVRE